MLPDMLKTMEQLIGLPHGMILATGPTGSGKTTTLYSALRATYSSEKKIITIEDPVEYQIDGVNQIQVHPQIGLDLRQRAALDLAPGSRYHHGGGDS